MTAYTVEYWEADSDAWKERALAAEARVAKLKKVAEVGKRLSDLNEELCASVEWETENVGEHRGSLAVLRDTGPVSDELRKALTALDKQETEE